MGLSTWHNTSNGILSAFILISGVCFCGLVVGSVHKAVQGNTELQKENNDNPFHQSKINRGYLGMATASVWSFGFAFIIPGLIGLIATCVKRKAVYITQMVFSIITLVVMGIVVIITILVVHLAHSYRSISNCATVNNQCACSVGGDIEMVTLPHSCSDLTSLYAMAVSTLLIEVVAWILTLTTTILAGIMACSKRGGQTGHVLYPTSNNGTAVEVGQVGMPPQVTYVPNTSDHVHLVNNMAY